MRTNELASLLAKEALDLCRILFPNGKQNRNEFEIGSLSGEEGKSLKVKIKGDKAGIWCDFADGGSKGDLIGLIMKVKGINLTEARKFAFEFLHLSNDETKKITKPFSSKKYVKPVITKVGIPENCKNYLINERKLDQETLDVFKIYGINDGKGERICFPFYVNDECLLIKSLKLIRDDHGKKIIHSTPNSQPCLFGWQSFVGNERELIICEGEIDAMSWYQYGYKALSIPFGVNNLDWIDFEFDRLAEVDVIYISMDMDDAGKSCAKKVIERLGKEVCRLIKLPHKDINECLQNNVNPQQIKECLDRAEGGSEFLKRAVEFYNDGYKELFPSPDDFIGTKTPWVHANQLILFRPGELSVWQGINGHGKSQVLGQIMLHTMYDGHRICIASLELSVGRILARLTKQAAATGNPKPEDYNAFMKFIEDRLFVYNCLGMASVDDLLIAFKEAHHRYGINTFLIDSFMMLDVDEDDNKVQKKAILKLTNFKNKYNCHIHLVTHPRKGLNEFEIPNKMSVKGTSAITDLCDNLFTVWRNKKKEILLQQLSQGQLQEESKDYQEALIQKDKHDVYVIYSKDRNGAVEGTIGLWFNNDCSQYTERKFDSPFLYIEKQSLIEIPKEWQ